MQIIKISSNCLLRQIMSITPGLLRNKPGVITADALKAICAMESHEAALAKAEQVAVDMETKKLKEVATCLREGVGETTTYLLDDYSQEHRRRIRTNNMIRTTQPRDPPQNKSRGRIP
jgi:transposase-like protein